MSEAAKGHAPKLELKKPLLLTCTMVFASLFSAIGLLILPAMFVGGGAMSYRVEGADVSRAEFMHSAGTFFVIMPVAVLYTGLIAYALYAEKPSSRRLLGWYWPGFGVLTLLATFFSPAFRAQNGSEIWIVECAVFSLIAWWYLYRKRSVVGYYDALNRPNSDPAAATLVVSTPPA